MALARCADCGRPQGKKGNTYASEARLPVGHPARFVDQPDVRSPRWFGSLLSEDNGYRAGQRVFEMSSQAAKLRVQ